MDHVTKILVWPETHDYKKGEPPEDDTILYSSYAQEFTPFGIMELCWDVENWILTGQTAKRLYLVYCTFMWGYKEAERLDEGYGDYLVVSQLLWERGRFTHRSTTASVRSDLVPFQPGSIWLYATRDGRTYSRSAETGHFVPIPAVSTEPLTQPHLSELWNDLIQPVSFRLLQRMVQKSETPAGSDDLTGEEE